MGWLFMHQGTRKDLIEELTRTEQHEGVKRTCLAHCTVGNVLWTVWEIERAGQESRRFIGCDLMARGRPGGGWGNKSMCEDDCPYYYSCPERYLQMAPVRCQGWRDQVVAYHARRNPKLALGDVLVFEGLNVQQGVVVAKLGRSWIINADGRQLRLMPKHFDRIKECRKQAA